MRKSRFPLPEPLRRLFFRDFFEFSSILSRFWSLFPPFGTPKDSLGTSWALIPRGPKFVVFRLGFFTDPGHVPRAF